MASVNTEAGPWRRETTFTNYSVDQGKHYASYRPTYHSSVFNVVLDNHRSGGGGFDTVLDVGCGPGVATADLAKHFTHATGLDPSSGMLSTARTKNLITSTGSPVKFELSSADDMKPIIADSSIDLITAFQAAHWFSYPAFWREAARVLKPNGSVALIGCSHFCPHPTMPNADKVQEVMEHFWSSDVLGPYLETGNYISLARFRTLVMPWDDPPITAFKKESYFRKEWDVDDNFFNGGNEVSFEFLEAVMSTSSPVTRWREAHPDKVGTEEDCVRVVRRRIEGLLHEAGVPEGAETFIGWIPGQVVMLRKSG